MGVATAIALGGLAVSAATTTASFIQAGEQRKLQQQAQKTAASAMEEARKKLEKNYYDELAIQKEPYELQREALISTGAQAIQAGVESERGAAATAGRVQAAENEAQAGIRTAMGEDMMNIQKMKTAEDSRLRDVGVQLDLETVSGAQLAARDAAEARANAIQQGFQGVTSTVQQGLQLVPLYLKGGKTDATTTTTTPNTSATLPATQDALQKFGATSNNPFSFPASNTALNSQKKKNPLDLNYGFGNPSVGG